jgi:hypothetical protein
MLVKRDDQGNGFVLAGVIDGLADDLLMPQMHAVKDADGEADFTLGNIQLIDLLNYLHRLTEIVNRVACCVLRERLSGGNELSRPAASHITLPRVSKMESRAALIPPWTCS